MCVTTARRNVENNILRSQLLFLVIIAERMITAGHEVLMVIYCGCPMSSVVRRVSSINI